MEAQRQAWGNSNQLLATRAAKKMHLEGTSAYAGHPANIQRQNTTIPWGNGLNLLAMAGLLACTQALHRPLADAQAPFRAFPIPERNQ